MMEEIAISGILNVKNSTDLRTLVTLTQYNTKCKLEHDLKKQKGGSGDRVNETSYRTEKLQFFQMKDMKYLVIETISFTSVLISRLKMNCQNMIDGLAVVTSNGVDVHWQNLGVASHYQKNVLETQPVNITYISGNF